MPTTHSTPPSTAGSGPPLRLRGILGPYVDVYTIAPGGRATIGRVASCEICLVHESVSRRHATVLMRGSRWQIIDEQSSGGTFVNGLRVPPGEPVPVSQGDLIRIGPWTFRADLGAPRDPGPGSVHHTLDDSRHAEHRIARVGSTSAGVAAERLRLLTECLARLHTADSEAQLAQIAVEHAVRGTGFPRGAILTPTDVEGEVSILASHGLEGASGAIGFSRSLIAEAAKGQAVTLNVREPAAASVSIAEMNLEQAMCAPVMVGETVCGFVYLDARRDEVRAAPDAGPFCEAVARAYGLALANAKRAELERRQQLLTAELQAARSVQQTISPPASGTVGPVSYAYHVQPGVFVAGDLFDVVPMTDGVAVVLGDVSGHGAGSGMVMALTQSHLNAHLRASGDLVRAAAALNSYLAEHSVDGRFVSLMLAVIARDGTVRYIDAGHGHWHIRRANGERSVHAARAIPLGIDPEFVYVSATVRLEPGDRLVFYSDGITEQTGHAGEAFGADRVAAAFRPGAAPADDVDRVMSALRSFAARDHFDDDATIASIEFIGSQ